MSLCSKYLYLFLFSVATAPSRSTCDTATHIKLEATSGYINSLITDETGCGSSATPWVIDTRPGESVNITLWDFDVQEDILAGSDYLGLPSFCQQYAVISERLINRTTRICGGAQRTQHVYTSTSASVEIAITRPGSPVNGHFMLQYQSK